MKSPALIATSALGLAFAGLLVAEKQATGRLSAELAEARESASLEKAKSEKALEDLQRQIGDLKNVIAQLEARRGKPADDADSEGAAGNAAASAKTAKAEEKPGFAKMVEKMFTDPEMKKMMRNQQAMAMQMMYGDLVKELGLGPEEAKQLMDLLADRQMALSTQSMKFLGKDTEGNNLEKAGEDLAASAKTYDQHIKGLLGDARYGQFTQYERTIGDRMQLQQYKQAFSANGVPLKDEQSRSLLDIMKEERLKEVPSPLDPANRDVASAVKTMQSDEAMDRIWQNQEALNQRVLTRVRSVLDPDQYLQFEQIQKQQLEMQKMGMKMGREMMKNK